MPDIFNLPPAHINGCNLVFVDGTTINILPGQLRDSANNFDISVNQIITLSGTISGVNGLDVGVFQTGKCYNVFVIGSSNGTKPTASVLSLSEIPTLPSTYDLFRKIGVCHTDNNPSFIKFFQTGNNGDRTIVFNIPPTILNIGHDITFTSLDLSPFLPIYPTEILITLFVVYVPKDAGNSLFVKSPSMIAPNYIERGVIAGQEQDEQAVVLTNLVSGKPTIDYRVTNAADLASLGLYSINLSL